MASNIIQNQATQAAAKPQKTIQSLIKDMSGEIAKALPSAITPERFTRMVLSALSSNPALGSCTPKSFLGAMMQAAQLGVEPNTPLGQAYLIPYRNHGTMECQFQLGYKGLLDLAYRSGDVDIVAAHCVHENDEFDYEYGLEPKLKHKPARKDRGAITYVYAMFRTKQGGFGYDVMSVDDIIEFAKKYSKSAGNDSSPWKTSFEEMAKKTVLKRVLKLAPLSSEFIRGEIADETIKTTISEDMYAEPDTTYYEDKTEEEANNDVTE